MTKKPILNFSIDPALLRRIDDFHHKHRFQNRAAAVKELLNWAVEQEPESMSPVDMAILVLGIPETKKREDVALQKWATEVVKAHDKGMALENGSERLDEILNEVDPASFPSVNRRILWRILQWNRAMQGSDTLLIWLAKLRLGMNDSGPGSTVPESGIAPISATRRVKSKRKSGASPSRHISR